MRDRDPADPEIVRAGDTGTGAFIEVALERSGDVAHFRFGVSSAGRALIQRVLDTRPFTTVSTLPHRYFYAGQGGHGAPIQHLVYIRIELGSDARTIEYECPADVVGPLEWFRQLPSFFPAEHLRTIG